MTKKLVIDEFDVEQIRQVATTLEEVAEITGHPVLMGLLKDNLKGIVERIENAEAESTGV